MGALVERLAVLMELNGIAYRTVDPGVSKAGYPKSERARAVFFPGARNAHERDAVLAAWAGYRAWKGIE